MPSTASAESQLRSVDNNGHTINEGLVALGLLPVENSLRGATEALEAAGDPIDDETAVLIGRLPPREVAGIQRADLAVGQQVGEVLVLDHGTKSSSRPATI